MSALGDAELVRVQRRVHSRVANIECDCFVYDGGLPEHEEGLAVDNCFFWKLSVDPKTLVFQGSESKQ